MTAKRARIENLVMRVQRDFLDDATLALTLQTAMGRFGVDETTGAAVLGALVDGGVLSEGGGTYRRHFPRTAAPRAA